MDSTISKSSNRGENCTNLFEPLLIKINFSTDFKNGACALSGEVEMPLFTIASNYKISGKILLLPVKGDGVSNVTMSEFYERGGYCLIINFFNNRGCQCESIDEVRKV